MKLAVLYDIHGNLPALEAVTRDIIKQQVDFVIVGGDVILGPMSQECLDFLINFELPVQFIQGNCEEAILACSLGIIPNNLPESVKTNIQWTSDQLRSDSKEIIKKWSRTIMINVMGLGDVLFCHATPESLTENFTKLTPEQKLISKFEKSGANYVICGHTHMQFDRIVGKVRVINAGSVGMPFGIPGAYWLRLGPDVNLCYTSYNLQEAAKRISATSYPNASNFARNNVIYPPSEKAMLNLLS